MAKKTNSHDNNPDRVLSGAGQIRAYLNAQGWPLSRAQTYRALELRRLPASKFGELWTSTPRRLDGLLAELRGETETVYIRGLLASSPMTEAMVASETQTEIRLTNCVEIHVTSANYKGVRGRSLLAAICDETGFWWSDERRVPYIFIA